MKSNYSKECSCFLCKARNQYDLIISTINDFKKIRNEKYSTFFNGFEDLVASGRIPIDIINIVNDKESISLIKSDEIEPLYFIIESHIEKNKHLKKSKISKSINLNDLYNEIIDNHIFLLDEEYLFIERLIYACDRYLYVLESVPLNKDVSDWILIARDENKSISDLIQTVEEINKILWIS